MTCLFSPVPANLCLEQVATVAGETSSGWPSPAILIMVIAVALMALALFGRDL